MERQMGTQRSSAKKSELRVERQVYKTEDLNNECGYEYPHDGCVKKTKRKMSGCSFVSCLLRTIPLLEWLPQYEFKKNIAGDFLSGLTVAIMHIPHGMAYGLLGHLPPVVGIYMGCFPVLVYIAFGTSRHVSIGTFAIICMMTGEIVDIYSIRDGATFNSTDANTYHYTPVQVATTLTFSVALFQLAMYLFKLGIIATLMSDTLVNAFLSASAFHVVVMQLKDLIGVSVRKRKGVFRIVLIVYDVLSAIPRSNVAAVIISAIFIAILILNILFLKPRLIRITKIPFPIELTSIVSSILLCYFMNLHEKYHLDIIGVIPRGLPSPTIPAFSLIPEVAFDAFTIAMISYTATMSIGITYSQKSKYEIDPNQELLALGFCNCVGAFFSCMPVAASLSRSLFQYTVGGATQVASMISCSILLVVLLLMGPLFTYLPNCVLASIIVFSLRSLLVQCTVLRKYWKLNGWDLMHWLVTFLTTVFIGIELGLLMGMLTSIIMFLIQGYRPYACLMGVVPDTEIYLDVALYKEVKEVANIKIFYYSGAVNFALKSIFRSLLFENVGFDPLIELSKLNRGKDVSDELPKCVILNFSSVTKVDPSGFDMLWQFLSNCNQLDIEVYIAACSGPVYEMLIKCERYQNETSSFLFFPTVHDAVLYAQNGVLKYL